VPLILTCILSVACVCGVSHRQVGRRRKALLEDATEKRRPCRFGEDFQSVSDNPEMATFSFSVVRKLDMRPLQRLFSGVAFQVLGSQQRFLGDSIMRLFASILAVACVLALACPSHASTVNFDIIGTHHEGGDSTLYTGTAVAPDSGTYWTPYSINWGDSTAYPVMESDGVTASPMLVTIAGGDYHGYWNYDGGAGEIAPNLMDSYAYSHDGSGWTVEIDHLTPGGKYDMWWYQQNGCSATSTGSFTFGGNTLTATNTGQNSVFIENNNYVHFHAVQADGNGLIFGSIGSTAQLAASRSCPSPSHRRSFLLAAGLVGLLAYAWRKRK